MTPPETAAPTLAAQAGRALRGLALAALNATLILVALCFFLALRLAGTVERSVDHAAEIVASEVATIAPAAEDVAEEVAGLRADLDALRGDLAALEAMAETAAAPDAVGAAAARIEARIETLIGTRLAPRLDDLGAVLSALRLPDADRLAALSGDPGLLVDRAVASGAAELGRWAAALRGCQLPATPPALAPAGS